MGIKTWLFSQPQQGFTIAKTSAPSSSFVRIEPKDQPVQHKASMLAGVNVTFSSGTTISIKQGDADSIIRLVNLYERKEDESWHKRSVQIDSL